MKKVLFLTVFGVLIFASNNFGQACGGSYLYLEMVDTESGKTIQNVDYRLYYVYPKTAERPAVEEIVKTAAQFYYGENSKDRGYFYKIYDKRSFLEIDAEKAENYIGNYDAEDYKNNPWIEHHEKQLTGKAVYGKIEFRASEMDDTPFLLKIEADGFAPVYIFSNFLGGCYRSAVYRVFMSRTPDFKEKKCLPSSLKGIGNVVFR